LLLLFTVKSLLLCPNPCLFGFALTPSLVLDASSLGLGDLQSLLVALVYTRSDTRPCLGRLGGCSGSLLLPGLLLLDLLLLLLGLLSGLRSVHFSLWG
jgi:hypothetical protein